MTIKMIASGLLAVILFSLLTGTARADGGEGGNVATVNGFQIALVFQNPAEIGDNEFHVQITDAMGMPVTNAEVEVTAILAETVPEHQETPSSEISGTGSMSGMSGMNEPTATQSTGMNMGGMDMSTKTPSHETNMGGHAEPDVPEQAEPINITLIPGMEAGEYTGAINLDKAGVWMFKIHFTVNGEMTEVEFPVDVVSVTPKTGILAGIIGFNASVIAVAAILKRKSVLA